MYLKFIIHVTLYIISQPNLKIDNDDLEYKTNQNDGYSIPYYNGCFCYNWES